MQPLADRLTIPAARSDPAYEFNRCFTGLRALLSQARLCGFANQYRSIDGPLNDEDRTSIKRQNPKIVEVKPDADDGLFADKRLFSALTEVWLRDIDNSEHLRYLSLNYPKIKYLVVTQIGGISDDSMRYIQTFKQLCSLSFHSFVRTPALLENLSPPLLKQLRIRHPCRIPKFQKLRELRLEYCRVDSAFFEHLDLPVLERMYFWQVDVTPDALNDLTALGSLKLLHLQQCTCDRSNLRYVSAFPYLCFHLQPDRECSQHDRFSQKAEEYFRLENYAEAYQYFVASVFRNASAYGYRRLARCCNELADFKMASLYLSWADAADRFARHDDETS